MASDRVDEGFTALPERREGFLPIGAYALLGDGRSAALVGLDGSVGWWALPTMADDPPFADLLDRDSGGALELRPRDRFEVSRRYVGSGGVLATDFRTATGVVRVTDALTVDAQGSLPWTELVRLVEGVSGEVPMLWRVAPGTRFDTTAAWARTIHGLPVISAADQQLALVCEGVGTAQEEAGGYHGGFTATPGSPGLLAVIATDDEPLPVPTAEEIRARVATTMRLWAQWVEAIDYDGPWRDAVVRSAVVHRQLTLAASGAVQAAATTSLPEKIGGSKNYDYRFSWIRDTGFALDALVSLNLRREVHAVLSWLIAAIEETAPDLRVFYSLSGAAVPGEERKLHTWSGYRGSSPVTLGNSAASQRQLGAFGDLLEAVQRYCEHGNILDGATARLVATVADEVCATWHLDDAGLWELGQQRPYTSSKISCWSALSRAVDLAAAGQVPDGHAGRWRAVAEEIREYVNSVCWSDAVGAYTFYAGTDQLDSAALLAARTGFSPTGDPRLSATIDVVRRELGAGGPLLYRYTGMQEQENAFVACSFWLVEALVRAERLDEAEQTMTAMVALANDVGLWSEQIEPDSHELVSNHPQVLSHLALISAASAYHHHAGGRHG